MRRAILLTVLLAGCASTPEPLAAGVYVLEGEADLPRPGAEPTVDPPTNRAYARFILFVDESGVPTHVREEEFGPEHGELYELSFAGGAARSEPIILPSAWGTCTLEVDRATVCATMTYDGCGRIYPGSDSARPLDGTLTVCRTDEEFRYAIEVRGSPEPSTILPGRGVVVEPNYPARPGLDAIELRVDGELRAEWTPGAPVDVGPIQIGSTFEATFVGSRSDVELSYATPLRTTATLDDLELDTLPEGALDARGEPFAIVDGGLEMTRSTHAPQPPFVAALALGAPPAGVTHLVLDAEEANEVPTRFVLTHAGGTAGGERTYANAPIAVPGGDGPVWLLFIHFGTGAPQGDYGDTLRVESLRWE